MLFTVEYIQASLHFLLFSVAGSWRAESISVQMIFFLALFSPVCLRHMATWHMLCVLYAETASKQTKHMDTHGQSRADGWELSQSTGHWVRHAGQNVSLTELTVGTVDPAMYI